MTTRRTVEATLYEPLDFVIVRAPLLPVEAYEQLGESAGAATSESPRDRADARRALAVGSLSLLEATERASLDAARRAKVDSRLLRYRIRMSTRPTPFGLFASVGLGRWGDTTGLTLSSGPRRQRTRLDMDWLLRRVFELEADPAVHRHLQLVANPAAFVHAGRVVLGERASRGEGRAPGVSIRATNIVRRALLAARWPIAYGTLAAELLDTTRGATPEKVDSLLAELLSHTLLLTDLRPPLTIDRPASHVLDRLLGIPAAAAARSRIHEVVSAAATWDATASTDGADHYRRLVTSAVASAADEPSPVQVDTAVELDGDRVGRAVSLEAGRAAELLLRLTPSPYGPASLIRYRRRFVQRYGEHREVALLELLDPNVGLGTPWPHGDSAGGSGGVNPARLQRRNEALLELATSALREGRLTAELDQPMIERLALWDPPDGAPLSLDLTVQVAATSAAAVDSGDFRLVVGPNVGALSAGRMLGRFADVVAGAPEALARVAAAEAALTPGAVWAELVYLPRSLRLANVSIRPNAREYEIPVGVSAGRDPGQVAPLAELVVGVRDDRFVVRWPARGVDVRIAAGHMLTPQRAPDVCRFLAEVSRDGTCQLTGFQWGVAATLPVLPRVQAGRVVLAPAQWRVTQASFPEAPLGSAAADARSLAAWREQWQVPRHVYLVAGDNRLLLDLDAAAQADELRRAVRRAGGAAVTIAEAVPSLDEAWVRDAQGRRFVSELVVPLVLRTRAAAGPLPATTPTRVVTAEERLRPLGSDWLFAKVYGPPALEDDLLAGPVRELVGRLRSEGSIESWFFIRYSDPAPHLRLRFHGQPERLLREALPTVVTWANGLIAAGLSDRFALDTYEREVERFGGAAAMTEAERFFAADSEAAIDLLELIQAGSLAIDRLPLAVLTLDALLDGLGHDPPARLAWCRRRSASRQDSGAAYRRWKQALRPLIAGSDVSALGPGAETVLKILAIRRTSAADYRAAMASLAASESLVRSQTELEDSLVHLHLNRLLGAQAPPDRSVITLLGRVHEGLGDRSRRPSRSPCDQA